MEHIIIVTVLNDCRVIATQGRISGGVHGLRSPSEMSSVFFLNVQNNFRF